MITRMGVKGMQVAVTGGAGFIGRHVCGELIRAGHQVTVIDNLATGRPELLPGDVRLAVRDIQSDGLAEILSAQGVEAVIHMAAQVSVARSVRDPLLDVQTNVVGTVRVLEAARQANVRRLVFISSAAVYGVPLLLPLTEDAIAAPMSPYGLSKLSGEGYVRLLAEQYGIGYTILRLANVYGPGQDAYGEAGVAAIFCDRLLRGEPPEIQGDGAQTRDFVYVGDVANAVQMAVERPEPQATWNVGSGRPTSVLQLWQSLCEAARLAGLPVAASAPHFGPPRLGDIRHSCLDLSRIKGELGWQARTELTAGLRLTLEYTRQAFPHKVV